MKDDEQGDPSAGWIKFALTSGIAVVALGAGLIQFGTTSAFSVRQPFLEKQTALCISAAEHVGRLASTLDANTWGKSREEFWMLYWGPLAIVEDVESQATNRVEAAMVAFGKELGKINPASPALPVSALEQPALKVAHACRDLLTSKWSFGILRWFGNQ
jgi:hypothetical protein